MLVLTVEQVDELVAVQRGQALVSIGLTDLVCCVGPAEPRAGPVLVAEGQECFGVGVGEPRVPGLSGSLVEGADLQAALAKHYAGAKLVRVVPVPDGDSGRIEPEALNDTDQLEIRVYANEKHRQTVLVARFDNLGKGASGAAVQNIALMLGLA